MPIASLLLDRLHAAGLSDVTAVEPVEGGMAALAGLATRRGGPPLFVKSFVDVPADELFAAEAEGLDVLRERGALATPEVVLATRDVLVLSVLRARPAREAFWEQLAHALARLHTSTVHDRFGWERDNWLGRSGPRHCQAVLARPLTATVTVRDHRPGPGRSDTR